jgi:hypothetical protein
MMTDDRKGKTAKKFKPIFNDNAGKNKRPVSIPRALGPVDRKIPCHP